MSRRRKSNSRRSRKRGVRIASSSVRPIPLGGILGYFQRAVQAPVRVVEEKPKTSVFLLGVLLILALATHGLTVNPFQSATTPPQPIVTISTNQWVYQPGDQVVITVNVSQPVNADVIWVFLEQPNNVSNYFQMLPPTGGTANVTLAMGAPPGNWTAVAIWNPPAGGTAQTTFTVTAYPIQEFPSDSLVMVIALAVILPVLLWRQATVHQNHSPTNT